MFPKESPRYLTARLAVPNLNIDWLGLELLFVAAATSRTVRVASGA